LLLIIFFLLIFLPPLKSTLFPYTTLFRSLKKKQRVDLFLVDEKQDVSEKIYFHSIRFFRFLPQKWTGKNWKIRIYKDTIELIKRSEEHTSELQSLAYLVCRLLLEKKKKKK